MVPFEPPPPIVQINCGGLGGGILDGPRPPVFHCTHPRVSGTSVYGPALTPADQVGENGYGVAAGHTTSLHELAILTSLTADACERWEAMGFGRSTILYRRTQIVLAAARLLPAHRRLPHISFLSGLWWKLLSTQPARILTRLPFLKRIGNRTNTEGLYSPAKFHIEGFSAGSYTGAVVALALRVLFPTCRVSAKLGAIAMPKGVFAALLAAADPERCSIHLIHAEEDTLCDWHPSPIDLYVISHRPTCTLVTESAKWMGARKHKYWRWLHCSLPKGKMQSHGPET